MIEPYKVVDEYVFYVPGIEGVVRGMVLKRLISSENLKNAEGHGLTWDEYSWTSSHTDGKEPNTHPTSAEAAARALFDYINRLDSKIASINKDY